MRAFSVLLLLHRNIVATSHRGVPIGVSYHQNLAQFILLYIHYFINLLIQRKERYLRSEVKNRINREEEKELNKAPKDGTRIGLMFIVKKMRRNKTDRNKEYRRRTRFVLQPVVNEIAAYGARVPGGHSV